MNLVEFLLSSHFFTARNGLCCHIVKPRCSYDDLIKCKPWSIYIGGGQLIPLPVRVVPEHSKEVLAGQSCSLPGETLTGRWFLIVSKG